MVNDVPLFVVVLTVLAMVWLGLKVFYQRLEINELRQRVKELKREKMNRPVLKLPYVIREKWHQYLETQPVISTIPFYEWTIKELAERYVKEFSECNGKCGMNYCDDNGCIERKRHLVDTGDQEGKEVANG